MSELRLSIEGGTAREPGGRLRGSVEWTADQDHELLEIHLLWHTLGKGTEDVEVVETVRVEHPPRTGSHAFDLPLPEFPWSFSGRLITLEWAIEALLEPKGPSARETLTLAPGGTEVRLS